MEPMQVGEFGTMCLGREPERRRLRRVAGRHPRGLRGAARAAGRLRLGRGLHPRTGEGGRRSSSAVFRYSAQQMQSTTRSTSACSTSATHGPGPYEDGRRVPARDALVHQLYFIVTDCDDAVARATKLGGVLRFGPMDSPYGRFAALSDPQGANFSVIDLTRSEGELPKTKDV